MEEKFVPLNASSHDVSTPSIDWGILGRLTVEPASTVSFYEGSAIIIAE
jgi:hypothetical protein